MVDPLKRLPIRKISFVYYQPRFLILMLHKGGSLIDLPSLRSTEVHVDRETLSLGTTVIYCNYCYIKADSSDRNIMHIHAAYTLVTNSSGHYFIEKYIAVLL